VLVVNARIKVPLREFTFTFVRSSGPGGQNVNKLNTKAVLRWPVAASESLPPAVKERFVKKFHRRVTGDGELVMTSQRFRDQGRNVADCLEKLRAMLAEVAIAPIKRKPAKVSRGAKRRRLKEKRKTSEKKQGRQSKPSLDD
jgi:ribosome-associated protein